MPHWIRVRDRDTRHEFDVDARAFRPTVMEKLDDPERWPDLIGPHTRPRPAKPSVGKDGRPRPADQGTSAIRRAARIQATDPAETTTSSRE